MMPTNWLRTFPEPSPSSPPPPPDGFAASRWMKLPFSMSNRMGTPPVAGCVPSPGAERLTELTSLVDTKPPDDPVNWKVTPEPLTQVASPPPALGGGEPPPLSSLLQPAPLPEDP